MFIQVIQGRTEEAEALRDQLDAWVRDHAAQAEGWLGTTAGTTDGGEFVAVVRFASADTARRNSDRPEQGRWWRDTAQHFADAVAFHDYADADLLLGGGADDAGFVQVAQGRSTDIDRLVALQRDLERDLGELRPEIIGGTYGWDSAGNFVQTVYFTSEAEARAGERRMQDAPPPLRTRYEEYLGLVTDVRYYDLRASWLWSPS